MTEAMEALPTSTGKAPHLTSNIFPIEQLHKVPGTSLDVTSFSLLILGAAAPVLFLFIIHVILMLRRRRTKERYRAAIFSSENHPYTDAWRDNQKEVSVWLTSNHIQSLDHSPQTTRVHRQSVHTSPRKTHWGTKYELEETITAFFDANVASSSTDSEVRNFHTTGSEDNSQITTGNNLTKKHKSFESLCDIIINNMASVGQEPLEHIDLPKTVGNPDSMKFLGKPVEEQSTVTESSMGEFSAEEEILRDFDAILSSYCDEESESAEEWHYMEIKY